LQALYSHVATKVVAFHLAARDCGKKRERCWIAEMDGNNVGCIFLAKDSATVARIRLLLVDPKARGLGARLVDECRRFARRAGYKKVTLWTHSVLTAARHIYEKGRL
jgi:N-acetylglutamate synthase-like GNAT family acetyltransferase